MRSLAQFIDKSYTAQIDAAKIRLDPYANGIYNAAMTANATKATRMNKKSTASPSSESSSESAAGGNDGKTVAPEPSCSQSALSVWTETEGKGEGKECEICNERVSQK